MLPPKEHYSLYSWHYLCSVLVCGPVASIHDIQERFTARITPEAVSQARGNLISEATVIIPKSPVSQARGNIVTTATVIIPKSPVSQARENIVTTATVIIPKSPKKTKS